MSQNEDVDAMMNNTEENVSKFYNTVGWEKKGKFQKMLKDGRI